MTSRSDPNLHRLARLAAQVRDARLARLAAAVVARNENLSLIAGLERTPNNCADPAQALAELRHQRWAELRRKTLMAEVTRQSAIIEQDRAEATKALARCLALDRLLQEKR